ncbi:zinc-binding dehydrogenase [Pedobacter hartonius]|uniref:zinc-binding dehydrogenase n=1 Tax=Pedobacter hartonius TaxID=425514 RepID=UPI000B80B5DD
MQEWLWPKYLQKSVALSKRAKLPQKITQVFAFDQLPEAQAAVESGRATGKVAVEVK